MFYPEGGSRDGLCVEVHPSYRGEQYGFDLTLWKHNSGNGFNITLYALPVDGQLALFVPREDEQPEQETA